MCGIITVIQLTFWMHKWLWVAVKLLFEWNDDGCIMSGWFFTSFSCLLSYPLPLSRWYFPSGVFSPFRRFLFFFYRLIYSLRPPPFSLQPILVFWTPLCFNPRDINSPPLVCALPCLVFCSSLHKCSTDQINHLAHWDCFQSCLVLFPFFRLSCRHTVPCILW